MAWHGSKGAVTESLLIITGSMGAGKTSVLGEASDLLVLRQIAHAAIDLDALGLAYVPFETSNDRVMYNNLQSVCKNYSALGVKRMLLARAIQDRAELELCRNAVSAMSTLVCRITASIEIVEQRVMVRESGILQRDYIARVADLNAILDDSRLEDFTVDGESRTVTEIALEMLIKAGWISREARIS